jgi:uncharacterized protein (UPF0212 family)
MIKRLRKKSRAIHWMYNKTGWSVCGNCDYDRVSINFDYCPVCGEKLDFIVVKKLEKRQSIKSKQY